VEGVHQHSGSRVEQLASGKPLIVFEAVLDEIPAALHLAPECVGDFAGGVFDGPSRGVRAPGEVIVLQDQRGARKMRRAADDLSGVPVVLLHDLVAEVDVLDGVVSLPFFDDIVGGDTLRNGEDLHAVSFDELIMGGATGHDNAWCDACAVLANTFQHTLTLLRRRGAVGKTRHAEDDERIEVRERGVVVGNGHVSRDDEAHGDGGLQNQAVSGRHTVPLCDARVKQRGRALLLS